MKVILLFIVPRRYNNIIELTLLQTVFFAILPQKFIFGIKVIQNEEKRIIKCITKTDAV